MKKVTELFFFGLMLSVSVQVVGQANVSSFTLPKVEQPTFKADTVKITSFGAAKGGLVLNTVAINKAIEACSSSGGGVVLVPKGMWLTGPITLKSNVNLHLQAGAVLQFSSNFDDYPLVMSYFEGWETIRCQSPISAKKQENIAITGSGIIDGAGQAWRPVKKSKLTSEQWKTLVSSGGILSPDKSTWYPSEKSLLGQNTTIQGYIKGGSMQEYEKIKDYLRPNMVSLVECRNVLLEGVTFQNSPAWDLHPLMCENLTINKVNVRNPWYAQNGDGVDIESCKNGVVTNSTFDVGDDGICIKSGKDEEGRKRGMPTENFRIENCVVYHGHGGFVIGSEMSGGVRNIIVKKCTFLGTDIGLRFKTTRGRGGVVENILVDGINMTNIPAEAINFSMYYMGKSPIAEPEDEGKTQTTVKEVGANPVADESTPQFKNFTIRNVSCKGAQQAIYLEGLPEMSIKGISFDGITIEAQKGIRCIEAEDISFNNVTIKAAKGVPMEMVNAKGIKTSKVELISTSPIKVSVAGAATKSINLSGVKGAEGSSVKIGNGVSQSEIVKK
jgi:DNA sulfur modification protein DndE